MMPLPSIATLPISFRWTRSCAIPLHDMFRDGYRGVGIPHSDDVQHRPGKEPTIS